MDSNFDNQLNRYLQGDSSEKELTELLAWAAETDENAAAFAKACAVDQMTGELFEEGRIKIPRTHVSSRFSFRPATWAAAAAIALSAIGFILWSNLRSEEFAVVAQSVGARLPDGSAVTTNREVGRETIEIASGIIRLDFDHGASMTVEGPARFELQDAMNVFFEEGVATFQVPESAKGFTVDTADAEVVDLGTAFGVSRLPGGKTDVCVFEGEVEVDGKLIREGEAVTARRGSEVQQRDYETAQFEKTWPVSSGVLQTTGRMKFVSPGPGFAPGMFEDNQNITVFLERRSVQIETPLEVDLVDPGEYRKLRRNEGPSIPAGKTVRSYLFQLDPVGQLEKFVANKPRVEGQITFDQPIVGLIANGRKLLASDPMTGHPEGDYGNLPRGLEPPKPDRDQVESEGRDVLIFAADRRTLILKFAAGSAVDQIRVLVECDS